MQYLGMVMPVLPGKTEELKKVAQEMKGPRYKEHVETHRGSTISRDTIWLQHTPTGDILVDVVAAEDMMKAFGQFVAAKDPYSTWAKQKFQETTGIDFNNPPPGLPEQVIDWQMGSGKTGIAFAFPLLAGKTESVRNFFKEVMGARRKEMDESRTSKHLNKEMLWINPTPMGDIAVVYLEGEDPVKANQMFAQSSSPFDVWFKQQALVFSGIDFNQPVPGLPELVFDYRAG